MKRWEKKPNFGALFLARRKVSGVPERNRVLQLTRKALRKKRVVKKKGKKRKYNKGEKVTVGDSHTASLAEDVWQYLHAT